VKPVYAVLLLAALAATPAAAQKAPPPDRGSPAAVDAVRQAVRDDKRALVGKNMQLSEAEAKRFWPIYDEYQQTLDKSLRRRVVAMQGFMFRDKPVTNLAAKQYATEMLAIDEAEVKARRSMRNRVMRALPAVKAARYMQLEEKIRAVQDYDAAAAVPLAR